MLESTYQVNGVNAALPQVASSRADLGSADESRQLPHRIAFACFAGDALVVMTPESKRKNRKREFLLITKTALK
jgi:hypothetical protein